MYIKRRIPINNKLNKNESITVNDDSCTTDIITNDDDEHSQEYISRRRISTIDESMKEEEEEETIQISSSPKILLKQPIFKQLKLDQFLKVVQSTDVDPSPSIDEKSESNHSFVSCPENDNEETNLEIKNDNIQPEIRRITRHTRLQSTTSQSETDIIKIVNGTLSDNSKIPDCKYNIKKRLLSYDSDRYYFLDYTDDFILNKRQDREDRIFRNRSQFSTIHSIIYTSFWKRIYLISLIILVNHQDVLLRQISDGGFSTVSSNDSSSTINTLNSSSISNMDRPLLLKKRVWTSSNFPIPSDTTISPSEVRIIFLLIQFNSE